MEDSLRLTFTNRQQTVPVGEIYDDFIHLCKEIYDIPVEGPQKKTGEVTLEFSVPYTEVAADLFLYVVQKFGTKRKFDLSHSVCVNNTFLGLQSIVDGRARISLDSGENAVTVGVVD